MTVWYFNPLSTTDAKAPVRQRCVIKETERTVEGFTLRIYRTDWQSAGYLTGSIRGETLKIEALFVDARNIKDRALRPLPGAGTLLLCCAVRLGLQRGAARVCLFALPGSNGFYRRFSFHHPPAEVAFRPAAPARFVTGWRPRGKDGKLDPMWLGYANRQLAATRQDLMPLLSVGAIEFSREGRINPHWIRIFEGLRVRGNYDTDMSSDLPSVSFYLEASVSRDWREIRRQPPPLPPTALT